MRKAAYNNRGVCKTPDRRCDDSRRAHLVGFNFLRNPLIKLVRDMIEAGEIGEVTAFRGRHADNYVASPEVPRSFRTDRDDGGVLNDLGSHIISMARYLVGPFAEVSASLKTVNTERPVSSGATEKRPVEVDNMAHALVRFENGAAGSIDANWAATGRMMDLSFEVTGTHGSIYFCQEYMNELHVCTSGGAGYTRFEASPDHHLVFNDLKVIEVAELVGAYATGSTGFCRGNARLAYDRCDKKGRFGRLLARCVTESRLAPRCRLQI